ncbi:MAG TPA: Pr6Pr family membrane protein [Micromonosporaceae bacterium]
MSSRAPFVIAYRLATGAVVLAAIVVQFAQGSNAINFFSFFTIEANLFAAGVFVAGALIRSGVPDGLRGASVTYMSITGVVYATVLSHQERNADSTIGWVNLVLHTLMPIVVFLDWLLVPPLHRLRFARSLGWLLVPIAYGTYTLIRGGIVHWYPYPFLNAERHSTGQLALNCVVIVAGGAVFIWVIVLLGNLMRPDRHMARAHA